MQGTQTNSGFRTFLATAVAIPEGTVVQLNTGGAILAATGASTANIGVAVETIAASGYGTVKLFNADGTFLCVAAAAATVGAALYVTTAGQITTTSTSNTLVNMVALEAATAQGDMIECVKTI